MIEISQGYISETWSLTLKYPSLILCEISTVVITLQPWKVNSNSTEIMNYKTLHQVVQCWTYLRELLNGFQNGVVEETTTTHGCSELEAVLECPDVVWVCQFDHVQVVHLLHVLHPLVRLALRVNHQGPPAVNVNQYKIASNPFLTFSECEKISFIRMTSHRERERESLFLLFTTITKSALCQRLKTFQFMSKMEDEFF